MLWKRKTRAERIADLALTRVEQDLTRVEQDLSSPLLVPLFERRFRYKVTGVDRTVSMEDGGADRVLITLDRVR